VITWAFITEAKEN